MEGLLGLLLWLEGLKSEFGFACIFAGFTFSGEFIYSSLASFTNIFNSQPLTSIIWMLHLFFTLPPTIYQVAFWYAILRRFQYFIAFWRTGSQRKATVSLPIGDIYGFLGSVMWLCYYYCYSIQ